MKHLLYTAALIAGLIAGTLVCSGCVLDPAPGPVPVPVPPVPPTPPPAPPAPVNRYEASTFDSIEVGNPESEIEALPAYERKVTVGATTIYVWVLDEQRDVGDYKRWEVHTVDGKITASFRY